jgi:hypothetical protein
VEQHVSRRGSARIAAALPGLVAPGTGRTSLASSATVPETPHMLEKIMATRILHLGRLTTGAQCHGEGGCFGEVMTAVVGNGCNSFVIGCFTAAALAQRRETD